MAYKYYSYPVELAPHTEQASFPSAQHVTPIHSSQMDRMRGPANTQCEYQQWWDRKMPRACREKERKSEKSMTLPSPSLPPALDFNPDDFTLPPPYDDTVDVEKAIHPLRLNPTFDYDVSSIHSVASSTESLAKRGPKQEAFQPETRRHVRIIRYFRYTLFAVYQRLFTFVFLLNFIGIFFLIRQYHSQGNVQLDTLATLASSNFLLAILIRQDYIINLLFRSAWLVSWSIPLRYRKIVARVYCYGGIHSGAAAVGTLWWIAFTVKMIWMFLKQNEYTLALAIIAWVASVLLLTILLLALPKVRQRYHDTFELTHRFLGWTSIILFWTQVILLTRHTTTTSPLHPPFTSLLIRTPTFWNLTIMTSMLIYPWLLLRRWTFTATPLSTHAVQLSFPHPVHKFSCLNISSSPLREWHPFATFPSTDPTRPGASMVISNAGNWTRDVIQTAQPKAIDDAQKPHQTTMHFWVKSHPKAGVLSLSCVFPRVLILTTGSGIGPSLSSLLDRPEGQHARLIWSTRAPLQTYGAEILDLVAKADRDAMIIDTDAMGRPDLLDVAWNVYKREEMEAVFVLSNEKVVKWVVGGLEKRGVPAFGPIWDS